MVFAGLQSVISALQKAVCRAASRWEKPQSPRLDAVHSRWHLIDCQPRINSSCLFFGWGTVDNDKLMNYYILELAPSY